MYKLERLGCHRGEGFDWIVISYHTWWIAAAWKFDSTGGTCRIRKVKLIKG
jgi:hypothetical protein